jgi:hypothetical protein
MVSRTETILLFAGVFLLILVLLIVGRGRGQSGKPKPPRPPVDPPKETDKNNYDDPKIKEFGDDCVKSKGVLALRENTMQCLAFDDGKILSELTNQPTSGNILGYLKFVYPLYPKWDEMSSGTRNEFVSKLTFSYFKVAGAPVGMMQVNSEIAVKYQTAIFFNTATVEVYPLEQSYKNFSRDTWFGCWYRGTIGSGWYLPVSCSLFAYNAVHALLLLNIENNYIVQNGSESFKALSNSMPIDDIVKLAPSESFSGAWLNGDRKAQRYLSTMAAQQGYKTIQLSNERDSAGNSERWVVHLTDPNYSQRDLRRQNPFFVAENPNQDALYLNAFLNDAVPAVDSKFIVDPNPKTLGERYGDFSFKTKCRMNKGTISIGDLLLDCLKILNFGLPAITITREIDSINFASYPQSNDLEKLQSYFSIVYGSADVWKQKTLEELTDFWMRCEVHYKLPLSPNIPYKQYRVLNFGVETSGNFDARQEEYRPGEVLKYVEVIRQNKVYSRYQLPEVFAATYYYPARGSGLFLPTGRMFVARTKQDAAAALGQSIPSCCTPEDIAIAKTCLYKGFDSLLIMRYSGFTANDSEIVHFRDPIASQMSLIKTHPFDPIVSESNELITGDGYFPSARLNNPSYPGNCTIFSMYNPGLVENQCF